MIHLMGHSILEMKTKYSFRKRPITGTVTKKTFPTCLNRKNIGNYIHTYIFTNEYSQMSSDISSNNRLKLGYSMTQDTIQQSQSNLIWMDTTIRWYGLTLKIHCRVSKAGGFIFSLCPVGTHECSRLQIGT